MIDNKEEFAITGAETSISGFELIGIRMINQLTEFQARTSQKFRFYLYFVFGLKKFLDFTEFSHSENNGGIQ